MDEIALKATYRNLLAQKLAHMQVQRGVDYIPHIKQADFHKVGAGARERLFLAGNRCGKTLCGAYEVAMHLTGLYPDWWQGTRFNGPVQAWAASVTTEATRDILQSLYLGDAKTGTRGVIPEPCIMRRTLKRGVSNAVDTAYIQHVSGGISQLGFKSYDQGRAKFQGTARHVIHLDEEPDIGIYEECLLRTATVEGHILLTMTPLMGMTPLCERFLGEAGHDGRAIIRAGWDDAPHLSADEKARLKKSLRPHEIKAREQGIPTLGSGLVYPVREDQFVVPRFEIPKDSKQFKHVFGLDFGWTNPTAAVWGAYDYDSDILYIHRVYYRAEMAPAEHAAALQQVDGWIPGVCDPAGQSAGQADGKSLIEMYAKHGVQLTKADNAVESGIMEMLERLRDGRLKVFDDLAPWLEEFRLYRRNEKGRIVKQKDHLMDATRYLITSGLALAQLPPAAREVRRKPVDWRQI